MADVVRTVQQAQRAQDRAPARSTRAAEPLPGVSPTVFGEIAVTEPVPGSAPGGQYLPAAAFDGTQYLVVWWDRRADTQELGSPGRVYGARVTLEGEILDPHGFPIFEGGTPQVVFDGQNFLVVVLGSHEDACDLCAVRVSPDGVIRDPQGLPLTTQGAWNPALAVGNGQVLVAWEHPYWLDPEIHHARITQDGTILDPGGLPVLAGTGCLGPELSFDGTNFFLACHTGERYYGVRIAANGTVLDPEAIPLTPIHGYIGEYQPCAVTFDGSNHLLVWHRREPDHYLWLLYVTRVTPEGTVLDPEGINLIKTSADSIDGVSLASSGTTTFLAWLEATDEVYGGDLYLNRLSRDGNLLDPVEPLSRRAWEPALTAGHTGNLLVWANENAEFHASGRHIAGARLDAQGNRLDDPSLVISTSVNAQQAPAVAWDGQSFLVVWQDERDVPGQAAVGIHAARVAPDGTILDPAGIPLGVSTGVHVAPRVLYDGANFIVLWWHNPSPPIGDGEDTYKARAIRVSSAGEVLDPRPIAVPLESWFPDIPIAAASNGNTTLLAAIAYSDKLEDYLPHAVFLSQQGQVSAPVDLDLSEGFVIPVLASDGTNFLLVDGPLGGNLAGSPVQGLRLGPEGERLDPAPFTIAAQAMSRPNVVFAGENYVVAWPSYRPFDPPNAGSELWSGVYELYGARVSPEGTVLDSQPFFLASLCTGRSAGDICHSAQYRFGQRSLAAAFDGQEILLAWRDLVTSGSHASVDLHGARLSVDGQVMARLILSTEAQSEGPPELAATASGTALVAYSRFVPGAPFDAERVLVRRIGAIACTAGADCASGFCVDGVCCDSACGNGDPDDCQACSMAAGAPRNGTCAPLSRTPCTGDACTVGSGTCEAGVCMAEPVACMPENECHTAACDIETGCASTPLPDHTPCSIGVCMDGMCTDRDPGHGGGCHIAPGAGSSDTPGVLLVIVALGLAGLRIMRSQRGKHPRAS